MGRPRLLVSDVDDTLLGDGSDLKALTQWFAECGSPWKVAFASGRFYHSLHQSVLETDLPTPDAVIGGVGSSLLTYPDQQPIGKWPATLTPGWADEVKTALADFSYLEFQPDEFQSEAKVSYFGHELSNDQIDDIHQALEEAKVRFRFIYSSQRDMDILPVETDKGTAARYLAHQWGFEARNVFVSGNSGNDIALFQHGFRGVVVGNALPELKAITEHPFVYEAKAPLAAGVLEGLQYWLAQDDAD